MKKVFLIFLGLLSSLACFAKAASDVSDAYWDYGIGFGAVRFEHYPASNESRIIALPFPTFQYRGKILRADDKEGAHLYLFKGSNVTVEFSGQGIPALDSSTNQARKGMADLPWMAAFGPQLVARPSENIEAAFSIFQVVTVEGLFAKTSGNIFDGRISYEWTKPLPVWGVFKEPGSVNSRWTLSARSGTKEFNAIYFDVPELNATAERPSYESREGLVNYNLSYYRSYHSGRGAIYIGGGLHSYDLSANRLSPLHKSDHNLVALIGFSYTLGESSRPAVPESETSSVIETFRRNRDLRKEF
jgi:outer membrane scaffolding protein for murein synthesis (MipA/OmpV family)